MFNLIQSIDETILFFIQGNMKNPVLDQVMIFITSLGNTGFLWITLSVLFLFHKRYREYGVYLLCIFFFTVILGDQLMKPFFGRIRPCVKFPSQELLIPLRLSPSFPSGHTMQGFACATVIHQSSRRFGIIAYIIASLIGFSRVYLFVHYPTDILGGILFGILLAKLLLSILTRYPNE